MSQIFRDPRRQMQKGSFCESVHVFVEQMQAQGYAAASVTISTRLAKDFATWLDQRGIKGESLSVKQVAEYLDDRWLHRRRRRGDAFTLHAFARLVAPDGYKASSEQELANQGILCSKNHPTSSLAQGVNSLVRRFGRALSSERIRRRRGSARSTHSA